MAVARMQLARMIPALPIPLAMKAPRINQSLAILPREMSPWTAMLLIPLTWKMSVEVELVRPPEAGAGMLEPPFLAEGLQLPAGHPSIRRADRAAVPRKVSR
jgi:hypothetical protein